MKKLFLLTILLGVMSIGAFAQLNLPRESNRSAISQTIGDTVVSIVYHRPNVKARKVFGGELVPYGKVWRTGANEATTFEISNDVKINGQVLPKGKYSLHSIPTENEWTIIFNKTADQWGSFEYDAKQDALRVTAKPQTTDFHETMGLEFANIKGNTADVVIVWDKVKVPFTIDVGDINGRLLTEMRRQMASLNADDFRTPQQAAGWVYSSKITASYPEAVQWLDKSIAVRETFGNLNTKARILADMGKTAEAIATAEKAIQVGKAATPAANTADLEKLLADWKAKK
jgi:hypothetical protein